MGFLVIVDMVFEVISIDVLIFTYLFILLLNYFIFHNGIGTSGIIVTSDFNPQKRFIQFTLGYRLRYRTPTFLQPTQQTQPLGQFS